MPAFPALLAMLEASGDAFLLEAPSDWAQGRTLYGGITAALCLESAQRRFNTLPPLRSAHINFIGPAAGKLQIRPSLLREGKSVTVLGVDLAGEAGVAARAVLTFGATRPSSLAYTDIAAPQVAAPDRCGSFMETDDAPAFIQHFDVRQAGGSAPKSGAMSPEFLIWLRHRDAAGVDPMIALLAAADAPPPAALAMIRERAPISTITWALNVVGWPETDWLLLRTRAEHTRDGYSSEQMTVWDERGRPLVSAQQCIAVFA